MPSFFLRKRKLSKTKATATETAGGGSAKERTPRGVPVGFAAASVLVHPHVTEKAGRLGAFNQYVFRVLSSATKAQIAQAVREVYGVRPKRVATVRIPGKRRRLGRTEGHIPGYKKAIVTLPEGKTIDILPK